MIKTLSMENTDRNSFTGKNGAVLYWSLGKDGALTVEGTGSIPDFYNVETPWETFKQSIKSVIISKGITGIGAKAFWGCRELKSAEIPDSVKIIHYGAFEDCCSLEEVIIPKCTVLRHIYDERKEVGKKIGIGCRVFRNTPWASKSWGDFLTSRDVLIEYYGEAKDVVIPENIREIGTYAFRGFPLHSVVFSQKTKRIGFGAFEKTSLSRVVIPENIELIEKNAFQNPEKMLHVTFETDDVQLDWKAFDNVHTIFAGNLSSTARQYSLIKGIKFEDIYTNPYKKQLSELVREVSYNNIENFGNYLENKLKAGYVVYCVTIHDNEGEKKAKTMEVFTGRVKTDESVPRVIETYAGRNDRIFSYAKWDVEEYLAEETEAFSCKDAENKKQVKFLKWDEGIFANWMNNEYKPSEGESCYCKWYISLWEYAEDQIGEYSFLKMWMKENLFERRLQKKYILTQEEKIKEEALRRMRLLKLKRSVQREFEAKNKVYKSVEAELCELNQEEKEFIEKWECQTGNKVYHVISNLSFLGVLFTMLYVPKNSDDWKWEKNELKKGYPMAYCRNLTYKECSEYGYIGIESCNGAVERII